MPNWEYFIGEEATLGRKFLKTIEANKLSLFLLGQRVNFVTNNRQAESLGEKVGSKVFCELRALNNSWKYKGIWKTNTYKKVRMHSQKRPK